MAVSSMPPILQALNVGTKTDGPEAGDSFTLPLDWVTSTNAILAKKRAGKTYLAGVIQEEMLATGLQFGVLDPMSAHWGIRSTTADGAPGGRVVIFGGQHADIPLHPGIGASIADWAAREGYSFIIDIKQETHAAQRRIVTEFCNAMLQHWVRPFHLFIEECTEFVPQIMRPEQTVAFDAVDRLVRLGGQSGIGVTLISQRAAKVNKDVLTQIDTLWVLRMTGPQDRKAVADWLKDNVDAARTADVMRQLVSLPTGTAFVWSPEQLEFFGKVQVRQRRTFHAGATPKLGQRSTVRMAAMDLAGAKEHFRSLANEAAALAASASQRALPAGRTGRGRRGQAPLPVAGPPEELAALRRSVEELTRGQERLDQARAAAVRRAEQAETKAKGLEVAAEHMGRLRAALRHILGAGVDGGPAAPVDVDAVVQQVLKRLPLGALPGTAVSVPHDVVLRERFQQQESTRLVEQVRALSPLQRKVLGLLEGVGQFLGMLEICRRLGRPEKGNAYVEFSRDVKAMAAGGLVVIQERSGVRSNLRQKIEGALQTYNATKDQVDQVHSSVGAVLANDLDAEAVR